MNLTRLFPHTPELEKFISPAKHKAEVWRFVLGIILIFAIFTGFLVGGIGLLTAFAPELLIADFFAYPYSGLTRASLAIELFSFSGFALALLVVLPLLHRRSFLSLLGPVSHVLKHFLISVLVFFAISLIVGMPLLFVLETIPNQPFASVLVFLPAAIPLLLIQTGAEEFLFRGYILQQLVTRFKSPWIWLVLPSVVFGLMHYDPDLPLEKALGIVVWATLMGILWTDLVRITGNIGAAFGWHFGNNFVLMNLFGLNDMYNGFAWRLLPFGYFDTPFLYFILDPILALVTWGILRRILQKRHVA